MENHNIIIIERTFEDLKRDRDLEIKDPYGIMASITPQMKIALLNNPSGCKDEDVYQILALDGDIVVGTVNPFPGRLLIEGDTVECQNGSNLFSHEDYRKDNVGAELFMRLTTLKVRQDGYFAGISQMALGMYKALKYTIFEFPRLIYLCKSRSVVHSVLHSESWFTKPIIWIADMGLWLHRQIINLHNVINYHEYTMEEVKQCPEEVEQIVSQDPRPFMELHDKAWFDWNIHYSFTDDVKTKRRLYVLTKDERIEAFLLTKQEFFKQASSRGFKNVYLGSVMEWGIDKHSKLTEKDIALLSLKCFDSDIDGIQYASSDNSVVKKLKYWFFIGVGFANIGVRIRSIKDDRLKDMNYWRIRLGGNDTILD